MDSIFKHECNELARDRFPLSSKYHPQWIFDNEMGPNVLWLTEYLAEKLPIQSGDRVMDLGCGRALSSIFIATEFHAQVWATDLWIAPSDNWERIKQAGVADRVFPIYGEARQLPYADAFFDIIVAMDSYNYFGTDELYLGQYLVKHLKPGGKLGLIMPGLVKEFRHGLPSHFEDVWEPELYTLHSAEWWKAHFEKSGVVEVETANYMEDGHDLWVDWEQFVAGFGPRKAGRFGDFELLEADREKDLTFVRIVARRSP